MPPTDRVSGSSSIELVGKVLGITGLVYGIGLVSINLSFFFWGFHDFEIPNQQAIYAGMWAIGVVTISCCPAAIADAWNRKGTRPRRSGLSLWRRKILAFMLKKLLIIGRRRLLAIGWRRMLAVVCGLLFAIAIIPLAFWQRANIQIFLQGHYPGVLYAVFTLQTIVVGASFFSIAPETLRSLLAAHEKGDAANVIIGVALTTLLGSFLLFVFACFYVRIPMPMGGGEPEQRGIWVSREALNVFDYCKGMPIPKEQQIQRFETQDANIVFLPDLWVLHESKDSLVIWREKCRTVALPKAWIKTYEWPMPNHN